MGQGALDGVPDLLPVARRPGLRDRARPLDERACHGPGTANEQAFSEYVRETAGASTRVPPTRSPSSPTSGSRAASPTRSSSTPRRSCWAGSPSARSPPRLTPGTAATTAGADGSAEAGEAGEPEAGRVARPVRLPLDERARARRCDPRNGGGCGRHGGGEPARHSRPGRHHGRRHVSDVALQDALTQAGVDPAVTQAALDINRQARVDGLRSALSVLALIALLGLFVARRVPDHPQLAAADAAPSGTGPPAGPDEAPTVVG